MLEPRDSSLDTRSPAVNLLECLAFFVFPLSALFHPIRRVLNARGLAPFYRCSGRTAFLVQADAAGVCTEYRLHLCLPRSSADWYLPGRALHDQPLLIELKLLQRKFAFFISLRRLSTNHKLDTFVAEFPVTILRAVPRVSQKQPRSDAPFGGILDGRLNRF